MTTYATDNHHDNHDNTKTYLIFLLIKPTVWYVFVVGFLVSFKALKIKNTKNIAFPKLREGCRRRTVLVEIS